MRHEEFVSAAEELDTRLRSNGVDCALIQVVEVPLAKLLIIAGR